MNVEKKILIPPYELNNSVEILRRLKKKSERLELAKRIYESWEALPEKPLKPNDYTRDTLTKKNLEYIKNTIAYKGITPPKEETRNLSALSFAKKLDPLLITQDFIKEQPIYYDENKIWWIWNHQKKCWEITDEINILNQITESFQLIGLTETNTKNQYINAFKMVARKNKPKPTPKTWIQFQDRIIDITTGEEKKPSPEYFNTNPIATELGDNEETPTIDRLFTEWVGEQNKKTLYEIISYACLPDYPIHTLFALIGPGRNGKTKFLQLLIKFIGKHNITSSELDTLLENRFESAKLYRKLICLIGETNFSTIKKTSLLKKLTGQDLIGFEFKHKNPFEDYNYAKIIMASNSLPSSDDTSEGFYRRWLIINFPNTFPEGHDILKTIPEQEYKNLARKVVRILPELLKKGHFTNQGSIEERKRKYIEASNPLNLFIEQFCEVKDDAFVKYGELYSAYVQYLRILKRRVVKKKEFREALINEGFYIEKTTKYLNGVGISSFWIDGIRLKPDYKELMTKMTKMTNFSLYFLYKKQRENHVINVINVINSVPDEVKADWDNFMCILLDIPDKTISIEKAISLGFNEEQIDKWKFEGLIYEPKPGYVRLL